MPQLIRGIHHAALKYAGAAKFMEALYFYHDLLGLPILRSWGKGNDSAAMLDTGNGVLEIFANGAELPQGDGVGGQVDVFGGLRPGKTL